ncbi:MAG: hypothetical protein LBN05_03985 [Oscillospiraceae bacterium]|nr:hypothetical protein [Oscillospiraceae bacterium]
MKSMKKTLSIVLAIVMLLCSLPLLSFATESTPTEAALVKNALLSMDIDEEFIDEYILQPILDQHLGDFSLLEEYLLDAGFDPTLNSALLSTVIAGAPSTNESTLLEISAVLVMTPSEFEEYWDELNIQPSEGFPEETIEWILAVAEYYQTLSATLREEFSAFFTEEELAEYFNPLMTVVLARYLQNLQVFNPITPPTEEEMVAETLRAYGFEEEEITEAFLTAILERGFADLDGLGTYLIEDASFDADEANIIINCLLALIADDPTVATTLAELFVLDEEGFEADWAALLAEIDTTDNEPLALAVDAVPDIAAWYREKVVALREALADVFDEEELAAIFSSLAIRILQNYLLNLESLNVQNNAEEESGGFFASIFDSAWSFINGSFFGCATPSNDSSLSDIEFQNVSSDRYSFKNSLQNFTNSSIKGYYISALDFAKLQFNVIKTHPVLGPTVINPSIIYLKAIGEIEGFGGSCYGIAATAILDKQGLLPMAAHFGKTQLNQIPRPIKNLNVLSAINYYLLSQQIAKIEALLAEAYPNKNSNPDGFASVAEQIVIEAKNDKEQLFSFMADSFGHAIVLNPGCDEEIDGYYLTAYDSNIPEENGGNKDVTVFISLDYNTVQVKLNRYGSNYLGNTNVNYDFDAFAIMSTSDFSSFENYKLCGSSSSSSNSSSSSSTAPSYVPGETFNLLGGSITTESENTTYIEVGLEGITTVTNAEGETLIFNGADGTVSGTMETSSSCPFINGSSSTMTFVVPDSETFTFNSNVSGIIASVINTAGFARAESKEANAVIITSGETVEIVGEEDFEYKMAQTYHSVPDEISSKDMIIIEGIATESVSLAANDGEVQASGVSAGAKLSVYDVNTSQNSKRDIPIGVDSVAISGTPNSIDVRAEN